MGSTAHMAYLGSRDRLLTQAMGKVLLRYLIPDERIPLSMLDLGCGIGDWTLEIAHQYPRLTITGIDRCVDAIIHAHAQAAARGTNNVTYTVMDARAALSFADRTFDVVFNRLSTGSLALDDWRPLVQECARVTRPGGVICLTACERGSSSSPALEELTALAVLALKLAGHSGSPDGRMVGITPLFGRFLREIGCHNIQARLFALDCSQGMPLHEAMHEYLETSRPLLEPTLLTLGLANPGMLQRLYAQAQAEMRAVDFCGLSSWLAVWGIASPVAVRQKTEERDTQGNGSVQHRDTEAQE